MKISHVPEHCLTTHEKVSLDFLALFLKTKRDNGGKVENISGYEVIIYHWVTQVSNPAPQSKPPSGRGVDSSPLPSCLFSASSPSLTPIPPIPLAPVDLRSHLRNRLRRTAPSRQTPVIHQSCQFALSSQDPQGSIYPPRQPIAENIHHSAPASLNIENVADIALRSANHRLKISAWRALRLFTES
jgi:hypothetical protein